jgi:hypothetical protein
MAACPTMNISTWVARSRRGVSPNGCWRRVRPPARFELARIEELAQRFADLRAPLHAIAGRVVDLLRIAETRYYHPRQRGSWKLKRVLPTLPGSLDHADLGEVQDGHAAMLAYIEAIQPETVPERRADLARQLRDYCRLDTRALVQVWRMLSGRLVAS